MKMFDINLITKKIISQSKIYGLTEDELIQFCMQLERIPTVEELAVCGALWSEHCSYKSSRIHLKRFHTKEPWVLQGPGENAGIIAINKNYGVAFKMESHNHPSYIEPYQGAATGVGGILRDIFCMGARPIANLNSLRFGEGSWNATLIRKTVKGIGDYSNSVGIPTISGDTSFNNKYSKNILVNALSAGIIHKDKIYKGILSEKENDSSQKYQNEILPNIEITKEHYNILFPKNENVLIYFGSATGRDGVHGATMSSSEFTQASNTLKHTVQVGDPFAEKMLLEATFSIINKNLAIGLQDMGAAGLTSSSVEMAGRSGCGVAIDLNKVPQRASNMQAWEILLSESQERMLCAVTPDKIDAVLQELNNYNISYEIIGKVNNTGLFSCIFDNKIVTAIPVKILIDNAPLYELPVQNRNDYLNNNKIIFNETKEASWNGEESSNKTSLSLNATNKNAHSDILNDINLESFIEKYPKILNSLFSHPAYASRSPIFQNYCSTVQGNTIAGCGALHTSSSGVIRLPRYAQEIDTSGNLTKIGIAIASGCEERWVELNPLEGAALSALKIARKIIASNGVPLAMTDCLNFGSPKSAEVMRQISDSIDGINIVAKELRIPIISGNVSLNNQTSGNSIPPTPMIGIIGRVDDVSKVPQDSLPINYFNNSDKSITLYQLSDVNSIQFSSYEASQTAWILGAQNTNCPKLNISSEKELWKIILSSISKFNPKICFPIGHGGLLGSLISTSLKSKCSLEISKNIWKIPVKQLFSEGNQGFIFGFDCQNNATNFLNQSFSNFTTIEVAKLKSLNSKISMPLFNFNTMYNLFSQSLNRYFN